MTPAEAAGLLAVAAAFDNRKPDADAAQAWAIALDGLRFTDCREAIVEHYRATNEWLMPTHVIGRVKAARNSRVAHHIAKVHPPPGLSNAEYDRWYRETVTAIADGGWVPDDHHIGGPPRDVVAELGQVGQPVGPTETFRAAREALRKPAHEPPHDLPESGDHHG